MGSAAPLAVTLAALALLVCSCASDSGGASSTAGPSTSSTAPTTTTRSSTTRTIRPTTTIEAVTTVQAMCDLLEDFSDRDMTPGGAYNELARGLLKGATTSELVEFADLLLEAPQLKCQIYGKYAAEIAYWLGL